MEKLLEKCESQSQVKIVLQQFLQEYDGGVIILNPANEYKIEQVNDLLLLMTGYSRSELINNNLSLFNRSAYESDGILSKLKNNSSFRVTQFHTRKNGATFFHDMFAMPLKDAQGNVLYYMLLTNDRTDTYNMNALVLLEKQVHMALEQGDEVEAVLRQVANHISRTLKKGCECGFVLYDDPHSLEIFQGNLSEEIKALLHKKEREMAVLQQIETEPKNAAVILNDFTKHPFWAEYAHSLNEYGYTSFWSELIYDQDGQILGIYCMYFKDKIQVELSDLNYLDQVSSIVSVALKYDKQRAEIYQLAYYDESTGLRNLTSFKQEIKKRIIKNYEGSLFIIQPTEYQRIVDVYGHECGNELLIQIAKRFSHTCAQNMPIIGRYNSSSLILATQCVLRLNQELELQLESIVKEPFHVKGNKIYLTIKIGMSYYGTDTTIEQSLKQIDMALSFAQKENGNWMKMYDPSLQLELEQEMNVLTQIAEGLKRKEFVPVLQPKVNIASGEIVGFEALARWHSARLGFVSPAQFIPVAEKANTIYKIDRQIFRAVLEWLQQRKRDNKQLYIVSINISPQHFYDPLFVQKTVELIKEYNIEPQYICLEITESMELENVERAKKIIEQLNEYGIMTSIDDFGIGYSSLSYLQQLPFGEIKIDKSFVDHVSEKRMNAVVKSIVQLAHAVEMISVAEGIETEEQHEALKSIGCLVGQGYYYYKPMSIEEAGALV